MFVLPSPKRQLHQEVPNADHHWTICSSVCVLKVGSLQCSTNYTSKARLECRSSSHHNNKKRILHSFYSIFIGFQWITVEFSLLTYRALNNLAPSYLRDMLTPCTPSPQLRSLSRHLLFTLSHNKKTHRKILLCGSSKTKECFAMWCWNNSDARTWRH